MPRSFARSWLIPAMLILVVLAAYHHALSCGWIWDDDSYVTDNPTLTEPGGLGAIWLQPGATPQYYPLVFTSFWLEARAWGFNPIGYHAVNVLLHAVVAVLWWRLLRRLGLPGAMVAAFIFALHPVHVESVAWVTERKNVLSGVFYLGAALAWCRFSPPEDAPGDRRSWGWYAATLLLFAAALLSKTVTATLPAAIVLVLWWKRRGLRAIGRVDAWALVPMFIMAVAMGLVTIVFEKFHVGAGGASWDYTFAERLLIAGRALWFYAGKLVWPGELAFIYPKWTIDAGQPTAWLYPLGALAVIAGVWSLRRRIGRGPAVGLLYFAGTLTPALGFFDVYPMRFSFVADHFQYLASMGMIALLVAVGVRLVERMGGRFVVAAGAVTLLLLGGLATRTWARTLHYDNARTLWTHTLTVNPEAWIAENNLGAMAMQIGRFEQAGQRFRRVVALAPDVPDGYFNLGELHAVQGDLPAAIEYYRKTVEVAPDYADAHMALGVALDRMSKFDQAQRAYRRAIELNPRHSAARHYLGLLLVGQGEYAEAIEQYEQAVRAAPTDAALWYDLGVALQTVGRTAEAIEAYEQALSLDPQRAGAHGNLAVAYATLGRMDRAIGHFERAVELNPSDVALRYNLALTLTRLGRYDRAAEHLEAARQVDGDSPAVLDLLAQMRAAQQRFDEAIELAQRAVNLAEAAGNQPLAEEIRRRIADYRQSQGPSN